MARTRNTQNPAPAPAAAEPVVEAPVVETPAVAPTSVAEAKPSKTEIVVKYRDHAGNPTERTFSKEVHGTGFAKLADEFKQTNAGKIIE